MIALIVTRDGYRYKTDTSDPAKLYADAERTGVLDLTYTEALTAPDPATGQPRPTGFSIDQRVLIPLENVASVTVDLGEPYPTPELANPARVTRRTVPKKARKPAPRSGGKGRK